MSSYAPKDDMLPEDEAFLAYMQELRRILEDPGIVRILDLRVAARMSYVSSRLGALLEEELLEPVVVKTSIDETFGVGILTVELTELVVFHGKSAFSELLTLADSFEVYSLVNGHICCCLGFFHVLKIL